MQNQAITSSNIERVGYQLGTLYIKFNSGITYRYDKAPFSIYQGLLDAESAGHFFHQNIKGKFEYIKLDYDPFKSLVDNAAVA